MAPGVRYQPAGSTSAEFDVGRVVFSPVVPLGAQDYGHGVGVETTINGTVAGFLAVALRNPDGSVPVTYVNGSPVLSTSVPSLFTFEASAVRNSIGQRFPIPADPMAAGAVLLWQYWFFLRNGVDVAVSEVFGSAIGSNAPLSLRPSCGDARDHAPAIPHARLRALLCTSLGDRAASVEETDRARAHLMQQLGR